MVAIAELDIMSTTKTPQLYRGTSSGIHYTGFNWRAHTYLTDNFETAAIYGRAGHIERAYLASDAVIAPATAAVVREIENAHNPAHAALELGIQVIWNPSSMWVGHVHPHEIIVFAPGLVRFGSATKAEQRRASKIAVMLEQARR